MYRSGKCKRYVHVYGVNTHLRQWLTTGRNSCPLCRAQGVDEKPSGSLQVTNPDTDSEQNIANNDVPNVG